MRDDILKMDRQKQLALWAVHNLEELTAAGFLDVVSGPELKVSRKGKRMYKRLLRSGFKPTDYELEWVLGQFTQPECT